jgi:N utilization substance protein B
LYSALEELEIRLDHQGWTVDIDLILTYVVKTIKRFKQENGDEQELLEMFDSDSELVFAKDLLRLSIEHADEYRELIAHAAQNWEADRIAYMDYIIMIAALTEITQFNDIALEVSMNEYIELAKEYSGEKSYTFINGILNKIVQNLRAENKLFKAVR